MARVFPHLDGTFHHCSRTRLVALQIEYCERKIKGIFITSLTVIKAWESLAGVARVMKAALIYVRVERVSMREGR